jgi:hypothetical protein
MVRSSFLPSKQERRIDAPIRDDFTIVIVASQRN